MTEPTAADRARAITWSHASAPWSKVEHEIEQAILAAEREVDRHWCLALLAEGPDIIQRVTGRIIEMRDPAEALAYTARIREKALEEAAREVETGCPRTKEWSQRSLWLDRAAAAVRDLATPPATEEAK